MKQKDGLLDMMGGAVDRFIGIFSPRAEVRRRIARKGLHRIRSATYAGAKTDRLTGAWSPVDSNINTILRNSSSTLRTRIRQLVRDFPYFARAVNTMVHYTVGPGIFFQSRVRGSDDKLDKTLIQKIEDAFNSWADEADATGKLHYYEIMQLAKRQDMEIGEFLLVKTYLNDKSRYLPFALRIYETDWLTNMGSRPASNANEVDQGIEYNKTTGQIVAYHFTDPDGWGKSIRIEVDRIVHGFQTLRPGQLRGVSPFAPAVLVAHDLNSYMDAEIDAAKMASKYLAFIKTPDMALFQSLHGAETDSETSQRIEEMENAILEYLQPGEEVELATPNRPGTNFPPFVKLILRMVAVVVGVPYELLSGDYEGLDYSSSRTVRNDFVHELRSIAIRHIRHFATPSIKSFFDEAVLRGRLILPGYWNNPAPYLRCEWQPPGMESVDPFRETKARIDEVKAGLRSPQEIARSRGRDLEEIYKEIKYAKDMAEDMGLSFEDVSTNLKNNPAALGANTDSQPNKARVLSFKK